MEIEYKLLREIDCKQGAVRSIEKIRFAFVLHATRCHYVKFAKSRHHHRSIEIYARAVQRDTISYLLPSIHFPCRYFFFPHTPLPCRPDNR